MITTKNFPTTEPVHVAVELRAGLVSVSGQEVSTCTVEIVGPHAEEFDVGLAGTQLSVSAPVRASWCTERHQVRVVVPDRSTARLRCGSARVELLGALSHVDVATGSGGVTATASDLHELSVSTGSGQIAVARVRVLRVKTGSGRVHADAVHDEASISSGSGNLSVGTLSGRLVAKTGSGDLRLDHCAGQIAFVTSSGRSRVECLSAGLIDITAASGEVRIGIPVGMPVWADVRSVTGEVVSTLPPVGQPRPGQASVEVRVQTVSGAVRLAQAYPGRGPQDGDGFGDGPQDAPVPAAPCPPLDSLVAEAVEPSRDSD